MTRKEIQRLRVLLMKTLETMRTVGTNQVDLFHLTQNMLAIEGAILTIDPDRPRETTALGARLLEAANEVGFDAYRLDKALVGTIQAAALTRLLYHDVKTVRKDVIQRILNVIGCEVEWLLTGKGDRRKKPIHPGLVLARVLGASESAIDAVMRRDAMIFDRSDQDWAFAFLTETKARREEPMPADSTTRLR